MQKLYGIKSILLGLATISLSLFSMHSTIHTKRTQSIDPKIHQKKAINAFMQEIAYNNYAEIDAKQQEKHIIWYTNAIAQQHIDKINPALLYNHHHHI